MITDKISRPQDWFDTSTRVRPYQPSTEGEALPISPQQTPRDDDDIDVDNVRVDGPTQPDQRVPCRWGSLSAAKTYDEAVAVLEDAINRFTDLCRVSFSESGLQLTGPKGTRIVWPVGEILQQQTSEELYDECITLSKRLYELIDDYNISAEVIGVEHAMELLFERVQEPDGLVPAVWALANPECSVDEIRAAIGRADRLAGNILQSSPDKRAEWERAKDQLSGVDCQTIDEVVAKLSGEYKLSKAAVAMAALASTGRVWNTDPQSKSILTAMSPNGAEVGEYYPLSKMERTRLFVRMEIGESQRSLLLDGVTWIIPAEAVHTRQGMVTLYRKAEIPPLRSMGFIWKRSSELAALTEEMAGALQALSDVDKPWGRELHNGLRDCMLWGVSPMDHEAAKVVAAARYTWKAEHGITDPAVEVIMGAINVIYSFTCEPEDASRFCGLHCSRCLRLIGPRTKIDSVPLYKWDATQSSSSIRGQIAKRVAEMTTSATRSVSQLPVLPHKMGYVNVWRAYSEKARTPGHSSPSAFQSHI